MFQTISSPSMKPMRIFCWMSGRSVGNIAVKSARPLGFTTCPRMGLGAAAKKTPCSSRLPGGPVSLWNWRISWRELDCATLVKLAMDACQPYIVSYLKLRTPAAHQEAVPRARVG